MNRVPDGPAYLTIKQLSFFYYFKLSSKPASIATNPGECVCPVFRWLVLVFGWCPAVVVSSSLGSGLTPAQLTQLSAFGRNVSLPCPASLLSVWSSAQPGSVGAWAKQPRGCRQPNDHSFQHLFFFTEAACQLLSFDIFYACALSPL